MKSYKKSFFALLGLALTGGVGCSSPKSYDDSKLPPPPKGVQAQSSTVATPATPPTKAGTTD